MEVHGLGRGRGLNGVPVEGPKAGGCNLPDIGPELISRADKGKYPTGQTTDCPEETLMSIFLSTFEEFTC